MVSAAGLRNAIRPSESTTYNASATAATARKSVSVDAPSPAGVITGTLSLLGDFRYWTPCLMAADQRRQTGTRTTGTVGRPPGRPQSFVLTRTGDPLLGMLLPSVSDAGGAAAAIR